MRKNALLLEPIAAEAWSVLENHVNVLIGYDPASLEQAIKDRSVHAVITRGKGQINKALMDACPELQVAARCGVGLDNVDVQAATEKSIMVINAPGSNAATIAEHTLSLMLMLKRNMYVSVAQVKHDNWNWRNQYSGDELNGKTLGVLGMGNIGKRVARLGAAFGMDILYWSRSKQDLPYDCVSLEELLKKSDVVSLHLPYTSETETLIGKEALALMKPGAQLINTARGALVDHEALLEALDSGHLSGFAADVLPDEPPVKGLAIVHHPSVLITPHSGSLTISTFTQMCILTVNNVVAALNGTGPDPLSIFNRKELIGN